MKVSLWMVSLRKLVKTLNRGATCIFEEHCDTSFFPIKFHLLGYLSEDLKKFGSVRL